MSMDLSVSDRQSIQDAARQVGRDLSQKISAKSNYEFFLSSSIYQYLQERHEQLPDEICNLHEEVALARHCLKPFLQMYSQCDALLDVAIGIDASGTPSDATRHRGTAGKPLQDHSVSATKAQALETATAAAEALMAQLQKVANLVKKASEVDNLMLYRFNGMEILHVIRQVEDIIFDELSGLTKDESSLRSWDGITDSEKPIDNPEQISAEELLSRIRTRIRQETAVVRDGENNPSVQKAITFKIEQEVNAMMETVPSAPQ